MNQEAVLQSQPLSWSEVHSNFQQSVQGLLQIVQGLSDNDLFVAGRFQAVNSEPLWRCIGGETYEHYQLHTEHVYAWLQKVEEMR
jgi:hypothetical protein